MSWYKAGTVAVTNGQNTVTGTSVDFAANARVGDAFQGPDGRRYEVVNIASATVLSILPAYQGATVTGGSYYIEPVQGYPKDLTDQVKQMIQQWGSTLAGLGGASTEDIVPVAKGGTGGNTPALGRQGLGLKSAAIADIIGTVSHSGGVPTGSILERGSNANGEYIKFADGTLFCWVTNGNQLTTSVAVGAGFQSPAVTTFTFPVAFLSPPTVAPMIYYRAGSPAQCWGNINTLSATSCTVVIHSFVTGAQGYTGYVAMGRWFA